MNGHLTADDQGFEFYESGVTPSGRTTFRQEIHRQTDLGLREPGTAAQEDAGAVVADRAGYWRGDRIRDLHGRRHRYCRTEVRHFLYLQCTAARLFDSSHSHYRTPRRRSGSG